MARVLLIGAGGFIGSAIAYALLDDGHQIIALGRDLAHGSSVVPKATWRLGDLREMTDPSSWTDHLTGIDIVVNASGALQSGLRDDVNAVQRYAIVALAQAAERAGARQFVQISAAGAGLHSADEFMESKGHADEALLASALNVTVLRPGLVIGRNAFGGTELIRLVSGLPVMVPRVAGAGPIQCIALDDVIAAVRRVLAEPAKFVGKFDLVEVQGHELDEVVAGHRVWLGFVPARWRPEISLNWLRPLAIGADLLGWLGWRSPLRSNAIAALAAGIEGNAEDTRKILGRAPLDLASMLTVLGPAGKADRWHARLALLFPIALAVVCLVWLASGLLGLVRTTAAADLLIEGGFSPAVARAVVLAGSVGDIAIAMAMLVRWTLKMALKAGLVLALTYCIGALVLRPDLWLDPLAPMLKVLPLLVLTMACLAMADER